MANVFQNAQQLYRDGFVGGSVDLLQSTLEDCPGHGELWELLGVIYLVEGQTELALESLERAGSLCSLSFGGNLALAECYRRRELAVALRATKMELSLENAKRVEAAWEIPVEHESAFQVSSH
ncbi:MAG: hypothetical protein GY768_24310 [Planctomycetaceae bacterium]|nr:hypothetical protein [Planctomycetaceae bacterium]